MVTEINERGYDIFHNPRETRGGGTAILLKNSLQFTQQITKKYQSFEVTEGLIKNKTEIIRICSVYRSGTKANVGLFLMEFERYLGRLLQRPGKPILCGDLNFHLEDDDDVSASRFKAMYNLLGFKQHVDQPTHCHGGWLDIILTTDDTRLHDLKVNDMTGTSSDHFLITCKTPLRIHDSPSITWTWKERRDYSDETVSQMKQSILETALSDCNNFNGLDEAVDTLQTTLTDIRDKYAPLVGKFYRNDLDPWWNKDCKLARRLRRRDERKYGKSKTASNRRAYKLSCNKSASVINAVRHKYVKNKLEKCDGNTKKTFSLGNHQVIKK